MPNTEARPDSWVGAVVDSLQRHDSWGGRVHAHKHLFILQTLELAEPPFEFRLYHYGPYSSELDDTFGEMEMLGLLDREYPMPGYGPKYSVVPGFKPRLSEQDSAAVDQVARALGNRSSKELELIATCLWAWKREKISKDDEIVKWVAEVKPQYGEDEIRGQLSEARQIEKQLASK